MKNDGMNVALLLNVRINELHKFERLKLLILSLTNMDGLFFSIRIRGDYSADFAIFEREHLRRVKKQIIYGETYLSWQANTLEQVQNLGQDYFILLNEDHQLVTDLDLLEQFLHECISERVGAAQLSWFPHYSHLRKQLDGAPSNALNRIAAMKNIDESWWKSLQPQDKIHIISLIGLYQRDTLIELLSNWRPFIKKYSFQAPFNFERSPQESWYLPLNFALPRQELFACIDDDMKIPGYSLIARGVFEEVCERNIQHHDERELISKLNRKIQEYPSSHGKISWFKMVFFKLILKCYKHLRQFRYSVEAFTGRGLKAPYRF